MPAKKKLFYGWWMVMAATILNFFAGGTFVYGFTVFFNPIRNTFGWGAAVTSVAFALQRFESGLLEAIAGFLVDKVGPRKLMLCGWSGVALGFLLMSRVDSLWAFYGSFLLVAMGMSFAVFVVVLTAIANWFTRKRSRAITLVTIGYGVSGSLVPLVALAISEFGWRETLVITSIGLWVISMPLGSLMRHKPSRYGYLPDGDSPAAVNESVDMPDYQSSDKIAEQGSTSAVAGLTVKAALKTRAFWLLTGASLFQFAGVSALMVHVVPGLESTGVPTTIAATVVTGITIYSLIGRLGFGFLGDFANKRYLIAIGIALQAIGIFIFSFINADRIWLRWLFWPTYASGFGATIPLRPALQADYFGMKNYGTIMGLIMLASTVAGFSPIIVGWMFDVLGSYQLAWQLFALLTLPAIPLILLAKPPAAKQ